MALEQIWVKRDSVQVNLTEIRWWGSTKQEFCFTLRYDRSHQSAAVFRDRWNNSWDKKSARRHSSMQTWIKTHHAVWGCRNQPGLTLQHVHADGPAQRRAALESQGANIVAAITILPLFSAQRQVPVFKIRNGGQPSALVWLPGERLLQGEGEEPLPLRRRTQAGGGSGEELPVSSSQAHAFDLLPGNLSRDGAGNGQEGRFGRVLRGRRVEVWKKGEEQLLAGSLEETIGTQNAACHPPTTVMDIWALWDFCSSVTTQVHRPLCRLEALTSQLSCSVFPPWGSSQWICGVCWLFGRSASQTRVTVCPGSTTDDGFAVTKGGRTR